MTCACATTPDDCCGCCCCEDASGDGGEADAATRVLHVQAASLAFKSTRRGLWAVDQPAPAPTGIVWQRELPESLWGDLPRGRYAVDLGIIDDCTGRAAIRINLRGGPTDDGQWWYPLTWVDL